MRRGSHLVLGCRNETVGKQVCKQLRQQFGPEVLLEVYYIDLGSLKSIVSFVDQVGLLGKPVYALVNNAGIFYAPPVLTSDQIEQTFEVNYLGHYLLTILLLPKLKQHSGGSRIVNIVSKAHQAVERFPDKELHQAYEDSPQNRFRAYQYSKFCLVLFAHKLSLILANTSVTVHCVDPGNVETAIYRHFPQLNNKILYWLQKPVRLLTVKTPQEGAQAIIYAVLSKTTPSFYLSNHYSKKSEKSEVNPRIYNPILGDTLWTLSRQMCRVHLLEMN